MTSRFLVWLAPVIVFVAPVVLAQQHGHHGGQPAKTADAPRAAAPAIAPSVPSAGYTSAFQDYQRFRLDEPMVDWRRINDDMAGLGGHAGHVRGAAAPAGAKPKPVETKPAETKPKAADHSQHGGKP
jgi:hypothetical protein